MRRVVSEKFGPPGSTSAKEYTTGAGQTI